MSLPIDLVSEFVKATNDDSGSGTNNSGTIVYGTTVEYDGRLFVLLDGSDGQLTPISASNITAGERVSVLIKNHTVTIMNNVNYPSAKSAGEGATNFLYYDPAEGLEVGDKTTGVWKGSRTRMAFDGFYVLDEGGDTLAAYKANEIRLGENNETTEIKMCGNKFTITYDAEEGHNWVYMYGNKLYLEAPEDVSLMSRNPLDHSDRSHVWMTNDKIHLDGNVYVNEKSLIDLMHPVGKVEMFTITTNPSELYPGTTWERLEGVFPFATGVDEMVGTMSQSLLVSEGEGQVRHLYVAMWKRTA